MKKKNKWRITNLYVVATHGNIHTGMIEQSKILSWIHGYMVRCDDEYQNMRPISDTTNLNYSLLLARFDEKISFSQFTFEFSRTKKEFRNLKELEKRLAMHFYVHLRQEYVAHIWQNPANLLCRIIKYWLKTSFYFILIFFRLCNSISKLFMSLFQMSPNLVRIWCKNHVLHHPIRNCHVSILLKIQYLLSHLITS